MNRLRQFSLDCKIILNSDPIERSKLVNCEINEKNETLFLSYGKSGDFPNDKGKSNIPYERLDNSESTQSIGNSKFY